MRLIDADALMQNIPNEEMIAKMAVAHAPSIDIVRCSECKLGGTEDCPMDEIDDEYYCNFGEREGE